MQVQIEAPGGPAGLVRRIHVTIAADRYDRAFESRIKNIAARVRIPGFRPGKAPMKVIRQQYGDSARADAINDLVRETWPQALDQAQVRPAGAPNIEVSLDKPGEGLAYVASIEVYPEVKLEHLGELTVKKPVVEVTEADVDRLIENLRKARRSWSPSAEAAKAGDQIVVDFHGTLDGEEFAGNKGEKVEFEIGAGQFLPDLENAIIGHAAGEQFDADVHFPEDYRAENLRGRTAKFAVTLGEVRAAQWPAIDGEFLKAHGLAEDADEAALRAKCRGALESERDKAVRGRIKQQVLEELLRLHPIELPQALVAEETGRLREEAAARMGLNDTKGGARRGGVKPERRAELLPDALFDVGARRRVALGLLVGEAIRARSIQLDESRVARSLEEIAADYEDPEEIRQYYNARPELMQGLRAVVLEEQLVETLAAGAAVEELPQSLEELLNTQRQA